MPTAGLPSDPYALAKVAASAILERFEIAQLDLAFVLGSGWSAAADDLGRPMGSCELAELPGFAKPTVIGHGGALRIASTPTGRSAAIFTGRTHLYEGQGADQVVHGVRTAVCAGANVIVLTNGCGGLNPEWPPGSTVLIRDHINLTAHSPIEGANFVDLTDLYSPRLRQLARGIDSELDEGVYVQFRGPHYETPAEVQMAKAIGGDIVGMSTALEAIAARQAGMEVLGMSLITNLAAGIQTTPLSHEEVIEAGRAAEPVISALLAKIVAAL